MYSSLVAWNPLVPASDFSVACRPQWHLVDCDEKTRGNGGFTTSFHLSTNEPLIASLNQHLHRFASTSDIQLASFGALHSPTPKATIFFFARLPLRHLNAQTFSTFD